MNTKKSPIINLRPCTVVWLLLLSLTIVVLAVGQLELSGTAIVALLLISTIIKTQMVSDYFMSLKYGRPLWRLIMILYIWIIIAMIGLAYWLGIS